MRWFFEVWDWFLQVTGTANTSGKWYGFFSGFGSDIGEATIFGAVVAGYRKVNCHSKGCWRIGHFEHEHDGQKIKLCRRCHPAMGAAPTRQEISDAHRPR